MGNTGLALVEEVAVRLQRGKNRAKFERSLKALLKDEKGRDNVGPSSFDDLGRWVEFYERLDMPPMKRPTETQMAALLEFGFRLFYLPVISEDAYPADFVRPNWGRFLNQKKIERRSLPGRFVAMETIAKPNWNDSTGYPDDKLGQAIGLTSRFSVSHDDLHGGILARVAAKLGLPTDQARLPYAEEWNFLGNVFNHLRVKCGVPLPDLGATVSWEWCENSYDSDCRLVAGRRGDGGLADVNAYCRGNRSGRIGFRVLAVF